jgi:pimeloyl-ACP methyl ester carboxylesterase
VAFQPLLCLDVKNGARPTLKPCKITGVEEQLLCGKLTVFENRKTRSGRTIDLNVVVLPALDSRSKADPLFDLAGGPGIAATDAASFYANEGREYRRHRDVVLVDQRGTGGSNPLHCRHDRNPQFFLDEMYPVEYVKNCRQELEQKADLTQYTTPVAMNDLDDVRAWLGYERINLFGLSYGTRAAQVYIRQHPDRVRSAILMGVTPTYHTAPLYHARDGQRALNLLLNECAADQNCNKAFPNIKKELIKMLASLERQPAQAKYTLPETGKEVTVTIRREVFAEKLRSAMYTPPGARKLPFIIHRAAQGDFAPFLSMVIPVERSRPDDLADGMYLSTTCNEDTRRIDPSTAARMNKGNIFGNYRVDQQLRACSLWPQAQIPRGYWQPVVSNIAVLILSGYMDPVTPPDWIEEVAKHLPNSKHIIIRHHAHVPEGLSHMECLDKMIIDFLEKGDIKAIDISCVGQMLPPTFFIEEAKETKPRCGCQQKATYSFSSPDDWLIRCAQNRAR